MIKFKMKIEPVEVGGDRQEFDKSEIGEYSQEERASVKFWVKPLDPMLVREYLEKYTTNAELKMSLVESLAKSIKQYFPDDVNQTKGFAEAVGVLSQMSDSKNVNWLEYNYECFRSVLHKWNIVDEGSNLVEFNEKNLRSFYLGFVKTSMAILNVAASLRTFLDDAQVAKDKSEEKNLETTSNGVKEEKKK